jgi:hypothetical protein
VTGAPEGFQPVIPATLFSVLLLTVLFPTPGVADWLLIVAARRLGSTDPETNMWPTPDSAHDLA